MEACMVFVWACTCVWLNCIPEDVEWQERRGTRTYVPPARPPRNASLRADVRTGTVRTPRTRTWMCRISMTVLRASGYPASAPDVILTHPWNDRHNVFRCTRIAQDAGMPDTGTHVFAT
ncbi:hypothetical protein PYCCODRAFT_1221926 [Trametes coccinea BRFM310]|uniref:Secreted protein n=1 Tax=Trametes coccinea (strain BRFM310) TaxID=1353009 RepID=A0A1Y2IVY2_TRAC3|nr:hypothetical protein PYCCODRAFT_1221926 [Trametes coccinea BRFM310]